MVADFAVVSGRGVVVDWVTIAFLVGGLLLIASELVSLSLVPVFLGVAALIVAALRGIGVVESVPASLLVWSMMSVALALPLRPLVRKYLRAGEARHDHSDEDRDAMGQIVDVVEDIDATSQRGRIRFQGTTWAAQTTEGTIPAGARCKLMVKDKLIWIVEPLNALDEDNRVPVLEQEAAEQKVGRK